MTEANRPRPLAQPCTGSRVLLRTPPSGAALGGQLVAAVLALALLALAGLPAGCGDGGGQTDEGTDQRPVVVTTLPVIYSLTANVAGDLVRLENLLDPGASPHQVSFEPGQARLVSEADLLIMNGAGLEFWVDDLIDAAGNADLQVLEASEGVQLLQIGEALPVAPDDGTETVSDSTDGSADSTDGGSGDDHGHEDPGAADPHVWLDVSRAKQEVENIRDALVDLDPDNADAYEMQADAYLQTLDELDQDIADDIAPLPTKQFVSFHSAFQYYAQAYGLEQVAVISESPGREPSPQYLAQLVDLIRGLGVTAVFTEPQFSSRPAETLAREAGVQTYEVDPQGADLSPEGYEQLMRDNTRTFVEALGGPQ